MASEGKLLALAGFCALTQGCFVFDEKLYKALESRGELLDSGDLLPDSGASDSGGDGDGDIDTHSDAATQDSGPAQEIPLHLVNTCGDPDMYLLHDTHAPIEVSTAGFTDDVSSTRCFSSVPGPEGW